MAADETEICNLALGHLGEAPIDSLEEDTAAGRACALYYEQTRDAVLRSHRWNFAQTRELLTPDWVTMTSIADNGGEVEITKTAHGRVTGDRVTIRDVGSIDGSYLVTRVDADTFTLDGSVYDSALIAGDYVLVPDFGWSYQYALPADSLRVLEVNDSEIGDIISDEFLIEGGNLLTDSDEVRLVYLRKVTDVTEFDPLFVEALSIKLAIALSEIIRGTTGKTAELASMYEQKTAPLARRVDANEGRRRKGILPMNSLAIRARFQGGFTTDNANLGG